MTSLITLTPFFIIFKVWFIIPFLLYSNVYTIEIKMRSWFTNQRCDLVSVLNRMCSKIEVKIDFFLLELVFINFLLEKAKTGKKNYGAHFENDMGLYILFVQ